MAFTDIINTTGERIFVYPVPSVLLGDAGGAIPTPEDAVSTIIPKMIVRSAGGGRLDFAELVFPLSANLVNRSQPASFTRVIDVRLSMPGDTWPTPSGPSLHLGDYLMETEQVTKSGESLKGQSQIRSYHFGTTLDGMLVYNKLADANNWIIGEILFNPMVDGKVLPNMSDKQLSEEKPSFLWAHPEMSQTTRSQTWQTQTLSEWPLLNAIQTLCHHCNPNESFIRNPTSEDLAVFTGGPTLHDVRLKPGQYLPALLDAILPPLGFNWYLKYLPDPDDEPEDEENRKTKPKICFFKRFEGTSKKVYYQMPGATLDLEFSNCNEYSVSRSIADAVNEVEVIGDKRRREVTLKLYPMWPTTDDALTPSDLDKTVQDSEYHTGKQLVWRAWIANEAGDITGLRSDALAAGAPPDLSSVFPSGWIPHRRTIEEPISMYGNDTKIPYYLEYSIDGGTTWDLCPDSFGAKLMPDQTGILFDGDQPPEELQAAGTDARVRITGTIAGDKCLTGYAPRLSHAVNGRNCRMVLYLPEKFQDRKVQRTGDFASQIPSSVGDERDDSEEIEDYAIEIRDRNNGAELDCELSLPGIHVDAYEIGDLITEIEGREVSLNAASTEDPVPRYPQITEVRVEINDDGPKTILVLDRGA